MKSMILLFLFFASINVQAQDFKFGDLDQTKFNDFVLDMSANFTATTVSSAKPLGKIFGFEAGLMGGTTNIKRIEQLIKSNDPNADAPKSLPHAGLIGVVSVPFGITLEVNTIPQLKSENSQFGTVGAALKWTMTENLLSALPFDLAIRAHTSKTNFDFNQIINNASTGNVPVDTKIKFEDSVSGAMLMLSKNFILIEPFAGIGTIKATGNLRMEGTGDIFDNSFTVGQMAETTLSGSHTVFGININLFIIKFGLEHSRLFDTERTTAKFSFYF
ncbi:MAG: DUF6588 family protein [Pseudomonadota bacterium]|nr:DUF6588 family protein [Pseudomonadota bacterium]